MSSADAVLQRRLGGLPLGKMWRRTAGWPWLLTLSTSILVVTLARVGPDWPAQEFRASLARDVGLTAWNNQWYGRHALPSYSLLYPPVATMIGAGTSAVAAAVACAWLTTRLLPPVTLGRRWFGIAAAIGIVGSVFLGQVPFLLGLAFGLAALLAVMHAGTVRRAATVLMLAAACSLASPLAGFFLLMAGVAWAPEIGWRRALPLSAAGAGTVLSLVVGGSGGPFPVPWEGLLSLLLFSTATRVLVHRRHSAVPRFLVIYAAAAVVSFVIPNPVGGNITRLAQLLAAPVAFWILARYRKAITVLAIGLPALFWQLYPVGSAAARAAADPSVNAAYFAGLLRLLTTQNPANGRLEIPLTREHWEAARVAPSFAIARGLGAADRLPIRRRPLQTTDP